MSATHQRAAIIVGYHIYIDRKFELSDADRSAITAQSASSLIQSASSLIQSASSLIQQIIHCIINIRQIMRDSGTDPAQVIPCISLFIDGPRNKHINITDQDARDIARVCSQFRARVIFHAAYGDNPFGSMARTNSAKRAQLVHHIGSLCALAAISRAGIVIHSSAGGLFANIEDIAIIMRELAQVIRSNVDGEHHATVYIETMSNDPRYADPIELNRAMSAVPHDARALIGLCVDTAHIWGAGAQIRSRDQCRAWFAQLARDVPYVVHFNDTELARGSLRDIHAQLGEGQIWNGGADGVTSVIEWAREHEVPLIFERHHDQDYARVIEHDLRTISSRIA